MNRGEILRDAENKINGERDAVYGHPLENHKRIALLWQVILGTEISPAEVALCMLAVKVARLVQTPDHEDSYIDLCGYAAIAGELAANPSMDEAKKDYVEMRSNWAKVAEEHRG